MGVFLYLLGPDPLMDFVGTICYGNAHATRLGLRLALHTYNKQAFSGLRIREYQNRVRNKDSWWVAQPEFVFVGI